MKDHRKRRVDVGASEGVLPDHPKVGASEGVLPDHPKVGASEGVLPDHPKVGASEGVLPDHPKVGASEGVLPDHPKVSVLILYRVLQFVMFDAENLALSTATGCLVHFPAYGRFPQTLNVHDMALD